MSAKFTLEGSAEGAIKAVGQVDKGLASAEKSAASFEKTSKRVEESLARQAQRIKESIDPQEKVNRKFHEMAVMVDKGELSVNQMNTAMAKYRREATGAAEATKGAFGDKALTNIAAMASGYLSVAAAVGVVVNVLKDKAAMEEEAAQKAIRSRAGLGSLSQLAAGESDPKKAFANLVAEARGFVASGAASDENDAGNLLFQLSGAGLNKRDRAFAAKLRAAGTLANVGGAAEAYSALKTSLGEGEVGNFQEFMSKSLRAAGPAPGSFEQLPIAAAQSGGSAKALGINDEFLLAATTILGKQTGSIDEGGTLLAAFLRQAEKSGVKGIEGVGGMGLLDKFSALPKSQQGLGGVFGDRAEAVQAFRTLRDNRGALESLLGDVGAAQSSNLAGSAAGLPETDEQLRAAIGSVRAQGEYDVTAGAELSTTRNTINAIRAERRAALVAEGKTGRAALDKSFDALTDWTGLFGGTSEIDVAAGRMEEHSPKTQRLIQDYQRRQAEALERLDRRSGARVTTQQE